MNKIFNRMNSWTWEKLEHLEYSDFLMKFVFFILFMIFIFGVIPLLTISILTVAGLTTGFIQFGLGGWIGISIISTIIWIVILFIMLLLISSIVQLKERLDDEREVNRYKNLKGL